MIRNKLPLLIVLLFYVNRATAYAAPEYSLSQEDTLEGSYYTLTYTESYNGTITDDDLEKNLEYEGQQYQLVSADIEYRYKTRGSQKSEKSKTQNIQLSSDEVIEIPQYEMDEDTIYILDESSLQFSVSDQMEYASSKVITVSKTIEDLPDNDLERISMTITEKGYDYELLHVSYVVSSTDEYGVPDGYTAECKYGKLENYEERIPESWQVTAKYDAYLSEECIEMSIVNYTYECFVPAEIEEIAADPEIGEAVIMPDEPFIKAIIPIIAASSGTFLAFVFWLLSITAPLYALTEHGDYKYIGRIRLRRQKDCYKAFLTGFLINRAEIQSYKIKIPNRIQRKSLKKILFIECPDKNMLSLELQKEVKFTIEKINKQ